MKGSAVTARISNHFSMSEVGQWLRTPWIQVVSGSDSYSDPQGLPVQVGNAVRNDVVLLEERGTLQGKGKRSSQESRVKSQESRVKQECRHLFADGESL
jgi:hypothetical protein